MEKAKVKVMLSAGDQLATLQLLPTEGSIAQMRLTQGITDIINDIPSVEVEMDKGHWDFVRERLTERFNNGKITVQSLSLVEIFIPEMSGNSK